VFPHPNTEPTSLLQLRIGVPVTFDVPLELGLPVVGVRLGVGCMIRTPVPEAAIYENCNLDRPEDEVGGATHPLEGWC